MIAVGMLVGWATRGPSAGPAIEHKSGNEPFGLSAYMAPEGPLWSRWRAIDPEIRADMNRLNTCRIAPTKCDPAARRLLAIVENARGARGRTKLEIVNRGVNSAVRWEEDAAHREGRDSWQSPLVAFAAGAGDCMDFAIIKYAAWSCPS